MAQKVTKETCLGLDDTVDLAGLLSFPASDPPGWTPTHVGGPARPAAGPELLHEVVQRVVDDVHFLTDVALEQASAALVHRFRDLGLPAKERPTADTSPSNVEAVLVGNALPSENIVIGARYDDAGSISDENATALAVLLSLAHSLSDVRLARTVRFVAFVSERGSNRYLDSLLREGPTVRAMVGLDGLATDELPWLVRRAVAGENAIALIGSRRAHTVTERANAAFERAGCGIPTVAIDVPTWVPGYGAFAHRSFARRHVPAFMVAGMTAVRRGHERGVTLRQSVGDLDRVGRVCLALGSVVRELANAEVR